MLSSIVHVAMETTKTCSSKSFISLVFSCHVSACELQPFSCHDLANDVYSQTAKTVFSHLKWKTKALLQKAQHKLTSLSVFPLPLFFRRLSTVFFINSETKETIPLHFRNVFHFFNAKNSSRKTFLVECVRSRAASCKKRLEFWRETHTPLWLLIGRIIFLTREKTSFAILIGRVIFFTCGNHLSLL